jgi:hypothetical protein
VTVAQDFGLCPAGACLFGLFGLFRLFG